MLGLLLAIALHVVHYETPQSISGADAAVVVEQLQEFYKREFGLRIRVTGWHNKTGIPKECLNEIYNIRCWNKLRRDNKNIRRLRRLTLVLLPGMYVKGEHYFGGLGSFASFRVRRSLSMAHCPAIGHPAACHLVAAHEVGHNLGARHRRGENFMNKDPARWWKKWMWRPAVIEANRRDVGKHLRSR
jgi:hypothetical protein